MENVAAGRDWQITIVVEERLSSPRIKKSRNLSWKMSEILLWIMLQVRYSFSLLLFFFSLIRFLMSLINIININVTVHLKESY